MSEQDKRAIFGRRSPVIGERRSTSEGADACAAIVPLCRAGRCRVLFLEDSARLRRIEVHAVIEDTLAALPRYLRQDYSIAIEPFATSQGRCVVLQDMQGNRLCILDRACAPLGAV
jgi:hypothetical protein